MKHIFTLLILFCCLSLFSQSTIVADTMSKDFLLSINMDQSKTRMIISTKYLPENRVDTIYDNLSDKNGIPTFLKFAKIINNKYLVMLFDAEYEVLYNVCEWDGTWKTSAFELLAFKQKDILPMIEVLDYLTIKVKNEEKTTIWKFDLEEKKLTKKDVISDKN